MGDTKSSLEKYIKKLEGLGFKKEVEMPLVLSGERAETFFVFFQPANAILLAFDTHLGLQVSSGTFFFNWRCADEEAFYRDRPFELPEGYWSETGDRDVYVGNLSLPSHDVGDVTAMMMRHGRFVSPWVERPIIDLPHPCDLRACSLEMRRALLI